MANTVNDVMNVIASPDYGIKNIAGTNQEILAILGGTHNSKNNIHSIVDDIRSLLQILVNTSTEKKKPVDIGNKFAKTNHKNVQNILDETKSIRKSIDNLTKSFEKNGKNVSPTIAKLSDKASQKVADAMVKNIDKQQKGGGMSAIVDAFTKLKNISLKDIIFGKKKVKLIMNIFKNAKKDLNLNEKDLNAIIKLINASPEMMEKLSKIGRRVNKIVKNDTIKKMGDILVSKNSVLSISKKIEKNEKTFNKAYKVSNDIKELASSLKKAMRKLFFASMWANNTYSGVKSLDSVIDKMLPISKKLEKNKKTFNKAYKVSNNIKELASSLKKVMRKLFFASIWAKGASGGVKSLDSVIDKTLPISKKLSKNKKNVEAGKKVAKKLTALVGNLLVTSILLTIAAVTGIPAILGAIFLSKMIDRIMPAVKKLSKNKKHMGKAIASSLMLITFAGIMAITSLLLATVAITGIPAIIGSIFVFGIAFINIFTFKLLSKSLKTIVMGSIGMAIMSLALLLFSSTLEKITNATKGVSFKQVAVIAAMTLVLGGAVMLLGIPALFPFILMGSISMAVMGLALRPFANTLSIIAKATENMKMKDILLVASAMGILGLGIAGMALLLPGVALGALTINAMNKPLLKFVGALKIISDMKTVPLKQLGQVLSGMKTVANFFRRNKLKLKVIWRASLYNRIMPPFLTAAVAISMISKIKSPPTKLIWQILSAIRSIGSFYRWNELSPEAVWNARRYNRVVWPFMRTAKNLSKLKEMGGIPIRFVRQTLNAMRAIGDYFSNNPVSLKAIFTSWEYSALLRPFGHIIRKLSKLKKMGGIPIRYVHQALNAMKTIGDYFSNNSVSFKAMINSWGYSAMLRPFGHIVRKLSKLKEMGGIPIRYVRQALNAMKTIGDYFSNNPISLKTMFTSWKYSAMLRPFGYTIKQLIKLKEMGKLPMRRVKEALNAIGLIADFYQSRQLGFFEGIFANISASMISGIVRSFGKAVKALKDLKEMRKIPTEGVKGVLDCINGIYNYYRDLQYIDNIDEKSEFTKIIVDKFITMAKEIQNRFGKVKEINQNSVKSIISACISIMFYYRFVKLNFTMRKVAYMNYIVKSFAKTSEQIKIDFNEENYNNINTAIKSMSQILSFLKTNTLNGIARRRARRNISILRYMSAAMSSLAGINTSNISSIGDALSTTLNEVKKIDISQVQAVTDMFNAFQGINKSENIINKFAENVKNFTEACKDLKEAMYSNTDALNNIDTSHTENDNISLLDRLKNKVNGFIDINESDHSKPKQENSIVIANVEELAKTIAEKINGSLSIDVPDTQVQLLINGTGGNEWTISRY